MWETETNKKAYLVLAIAVVLVVGALITIRIHKEEERHQELVWQQRKQQTEALAVEKAAEERASLTKAMKTRSRLLALSQYVPPTEYKPGDAVWAYVLDQDSLMPDDRYNYHGIVVECRKPMYLVRVTPKRGTVFTTQWYRHDELEHHFTNKLIPNEAGDDWNGVKIYTLAYEEEAARCLKEKK